MAVMVVYPSEQIGLEQRIDQIEQQSRSDETGERIVEDHMRLLQLIAGVDVSDRYGEERKSDRQHDDVQHGNAPGKRCSFLADTYRRYRSLTYVNAGKSAACPLVTVTIRVGIREGGERNRIGIL